MIAKMDCGYQTVCYFLRHFVFYFVPPKPRISTHFLSSMAIPAVITSHGTQGTSTPAHTPFFSAVFTAKREEMQNKSESHGLFCDFILESKSN